MTEREQIIANLLYMKRDCLEGSDTDKTLDRTIALLKRDVPETNVGEWISVKDRLPEEGVDVLVWEKQGFAYCDMLKSGVWNIGANNGAIISHWMPLPEPPKEET